MLEPGEIVLDLSKCGKYSLPVIRHSFIVLGLYCRTVALRKPASNRVSADGGPDGPEAAWPGKPIGKGEALESACCA